MLCKRDDEKKGIRYFCKLDVKIVVKVSLDSLVLRYRNSIFTKELSTFLECFYNSSKLIR